MLWASAGELEGRVGRRAGFVIPLICVASDDVRRNLPAAFAGRAFYERIVSLNRVLDVEARGRHAVDAIMTQ